MTKERRIDELALAAGIATTTVRLYQSKGLLPSPRLVGRTGFYDEAHLERLRVIARLQDQGFSLAGIGRLLEQWEDGSDLADVLGAEHDVSRLLAGARSATLTLEEVLARFPSNALTPDLVQRAAELGLIGATEDGRMHVADIRFLDTGATLAHLGVPTDVILDEWERLRSTTRSIVKRFASVFEEHLAPPDWRNGLTADQARHLATTLGTLHSAATQIVEAALDQAIAELAAKRFSELIDPIDTPRRDPA